MRGFIKMEIGKIKEKFFIGKLRKFYKINLWELFLFYCIWRNFKKDYEKIGYSLEYKVFEEILMDYISCIFEENVKRKDL